MFAYISIHIRLLAVAIMMLIASNAMAQVDGAVRVNPEDRDVDLDDPTFVPMVRVGKVLQGRDSIQYVELNNIYIYIQSLFSRTKNSVWLTTVWYIILKRCCR